MTRSPRFGVRRRPARSVGSRGLVIVAVDAGFGKADARQRWLDKCAGNATRPEGSIDDGDFDGDLMCTAAGGRSSAPEQATRPVLNGWLRP